MNAKGRVKEDGVFKFYERESCQRGMSYRARRTTYDVRRTTHDARRTTHDARSTMHNALPKTHDPRPTTHPRQLVNLVSQALHQTL